MSYKKQQRCIYCENKGTRNGYCINCGKGFCESCYGRGHKIVTIHKNGTKTEFKETCKDCNGIGYIINN